jgi:hypothetical protein
VMINKVYLAHNVVSETTGSDLEKQYYVWWKGMGIMPSEHGRKS